MALLKNIWQSKACRSIFCLIGLIAVILVLYHKIFPWPYRFYSDVKAYTYNLANDDDATILKGGKLTEDVFNPKGVRLNEQQVKILLAAINGSHPNHPHAMCYVPHHAFVFYSKTGKPVGSIEVCFGCLNYETWPKGLQPPFDITAMKKLVLDLDLPIYDKEDDYSKLKKSGR